jgi:hypothetical protein
LSKKKKKKKKNAVEDDVLAPWFQKITEFHVFLNERVHYTFGCELYSYERIVDDVPFPPIEFVESHPLLRTPIKLNKTKIYAFAFWIDFCISVVPRKLIIQTVHRSKTVQPTHCISGHSISFPEEITPAQGSTHVKKLLVSIIQVTDRIAETHECCKLTQEYTNFLLPASSTMKLPTSPASTYPDFAGQKWNPMEHRNPNKSNPIDDVTQGASDTSVAQNEADNLDQLEVSFPQQITDDTSSSLFPQKGKRKRLQAKEKGAGAGLKKSLKKPPQVVHPQAETRSTSTRPEGTVLVPPSKDVLVVPLAASIPIVPCASADHSLAASIPIVPCASADHYALEFNSIGTAEERKQDILWIVLRIFHEASRLPGEGRSIPEYLHIIRKHLENLQQVRVDVILEIEDKDVVNGLPNHAGNIAYREIIREWIERYKSTETKSLKRKVVEELMLSLREDGFRFLEKIDSSGKIDGWQVMDIVSTRNKVVKSLSTCKTTRKGDAPDDTTGAPLGVDTVLYSDKDIMFGKVSNYKRKHPGNIVYRDKVMSVLEEFRLQTLAEEKLKISRSVVDDLRKQDYCFVLEAEEGVFNQIELSSVVQKVYKCLKDKLKRTNPCKPKIHG